MVPDISHYICIEGGYHSTLASAKSKRICQHGQYSSVNFSRKSILFTQETSAEHIHTMHGFVGPNVYQKCLLSGKNADLCY